MDLNKLSASEIAEKIRKKEVSSFEVTKSALDFAKEKNKEINAFITITEEEAITKAMAVDEKIAAGEEVSPLAGVPYA